MLDDQESIRQLKLKFKNTEITKEGVRVLIDIISNLNTLENVSLDFSDSEIGSLDLTLIELIAKKENLKLMTLSLSNAKLDKKTVEGLIEIAIDIFNLEKNKLRLNLQLYIFH